MQPGDSSETWISSIIGNGSLAGRSLHELMNSHQRQLLGSAAPVNTPHGPQFPLLIKFLDAEQDLSVQVHPPPAYANSHPNAFVKNEAWHVLAHGTSARILIGAKAGTDRQEFEKSLRAGECESMLNAVQVKVGETYYLPSGTVHALGAGILAAEVQTPSDTTYRVFDFNRVEPATGKARALHIEQAMNCIDFAADYRRYYTPATAGSLKLAEAPQWVMLQVTANNQTKATFRDGLSAVVLCVEGSGSVDSSGECVPFALGETLLLPAEGEFSVGGNPSCRILVAGFPPFTVSDIL
jgi:mannose-6-phosphate isomerase